MSKFFITCDEATMICDKNQYKEATFWEKVKLTYHLFICKKCGVYTEQNSIITKACNTHLHEHQPEHCLTDQDKAKIQENIAKEIKVK